MTSEYLWHGVLVIALSVALAAPARADSLKTTSNHILIGIVVVTAAVAVVLTSVVIHYYKKRTITGCVSSGASGMTVTDEKDEQIYVLSGNTAGIKPGDRMKLHGKKVKPEAGDKRLVWETKETKDFGVCQP